MAFLTPDDFNTRLYQEKITAIEGGDAGILQTAIDVAVAEAKLYLSRFDLADLFGKQGDDRDPILLQWCKDISVWQFIALTNPGIDYGDAEIRRNNAIAGLKQIQNSSAVPMGWMLLAPVDGSPGDPGSSFQIGSQHCKRNTYR